MDDFELNPLRYFDKNLQTFYYKVIGMEVDLNAMWKVHSIRRALTEVVKAYKKRPRRKSDIRFDTPYRRCAYLLKHSPCFTSAVAKYFYALVSQQKDLISESFKSGKLSICCLGGGPATDAVALINIIRWLYKPYWLKHRNTLELSVSVVDISEEWQETAKNVLESLKSNPDFFGKGELSLSYTFFTADITQKMDTQLQMAIKSADIITMIYFLSAVTGTRGRKTSEDMVENIMLQMKKGAFVFFLDSAVDKHYEILNKASEKRNVMQQIYGPLVEEFHTISIESVKVFIDIYSQHFHNLICMTNMFFCVSSWKKPLKKETRQYIRRELLYEKPAAWKKPTEEESEHLTQKMKQYRSTVYRLLNESRKSKAASNVETNRREMLVFKNYGKNHRELEQPRQSELKNNTDGYLTISRNLGNNHLEKQKAVNTTNDNAFSNGFGSNQKSYQNKNSHGWNQNKMIYAV